jgi:hypothetical protein
MSKIDIYGDMKKALAGMTFGLDTECESFCAGEEFSPGDPAFGIVGDDKMAYRDREPVTVVMGLDTFKNMIITSFNIGRDAETGADLAFDMSFSELKIVKSQSVEINSAQIAKGNSASDQAQGVHDRGAAAKEEASPFSEVYKEANRRLDESGFTGEYVGQR